MAPDQAVLVFGLNEFSRNLVPFLSLMGLPLQYRIRLTRLQDFVETVEVRDGLMVDGLMVDGLTVDELIVDGLMVDGLMVDGLMVYGSMVDGLMVDWSS